MDPLTPQLTAQQMGVTALEERLRLLKIKGGFWRSMAEPALAAKHEDLLIERIKEAELELVRFREGRSQATQRLAEHDANVAKLEKTIEMAKQNATVAEALWMQLMLERDKTNREAKRR
jgi:hypothetical protein